MPVPLAIIPLFNHAKTIVDVLDAVAPHRLPIIVVDDGSADGGADVAERWFQSSAAEGGVIRLSKNGGKAAALLAGFDAARARGATHALTIDADGQHDAGRIPAFLACLDADADRADRILVLGDRRPLPRHYPLPRLVGRTLSGLAVRAACGVSVGDAACGMRLYPLEPLERVRCRSGRYAWEEEAIARLVWIGAIVREVTIPVIYRDKSIAPSHYRFVRDWSEGTLVLVSTILLRVLSVGSPSDSDSDLWWPLPTGRRSPEYASLLAVFCGALGAVLFAKATLLAALANVSVGAVQAIAAAGFAWAVWRTRAPLLAAALGSLFGATLPLTALAAAVPLAGVLVVLIIHARRLRGG